MKKVLAMLFVMLLLQGCVSAPNAPFKPSEGLIYTHYKAPLTTNFNKTQNVTTKGVSSVTQVAYYIFGFTIGDASLKKAVNDGYLKDALYADYDWMRILGIFGKLKVRAYGLKRP